MSRLWRANAMEIGRTTPQRHAVEEALDRIRPALVADGGNLELRAVNRDGTVRIELQGACASSRPSDRTTCTIG